MSDDKMKKFRVAILYDATTVHEVEALDESDAVERSMDEAGVSLCFRCSNKLEVGDPIRAAWVEDLETGGCDSDIDPDHGVLVVRSMLRRWVELYRGLCESGSLAQDEKGATLLAETEALLEPGVL